MVAGANTLAGTLLNSVAATVRRVAVGDFRCCNCLVAQLVNSTRHNCLTRKVLRAIRARRCLSCAMCVKRDCCPACFELTFNSGRKIQIDRGAKKYHGDELQPQHCSTRFAHSALGCVVNMSAALHEMLLRKCAKFYVRKCTYVRRYIYMM